MGQEGRTGRRLAVMWAMAALAVGCLAVLLIGTGNGRAAQRHKTRHIPNGPQAHDDSYSTTNLGTLAEHSRNGVLANDGGGPVQLISHTDPDGSPSSRCAQQAPSAQAIARTGDGSRQNELPPRQTRTTP